jgi:hypothetical protein
MTDTEVAEGGASVKTWLPMPVTVVGMRTVVIEAHLKKEFSGMKFT